MRISFGSNRPLAAPLEREQSGDDAGSSVRMAAKKLISGKTSVLMLGLAASFVVCSTLAMSRRASAQSSGAEPPAINFGPVGMVYYGDEGVSNLTVKTLLPAAPNPTTPFRVEAFTNYKHVALDIPPSGRGINETIIFFENDGNGKLRLWIEDLATGAYASSDEIGNEPDAKYCSASVHPAVRTNGKLAYPLAAVESADVLGTMTTEDGFTEFYTYTFEVMPAPLGGLGG